MRWLKCRGQAEPKWAHYAETFVWGTEGYFVFSFIHFHVVFFSPLATLPCLRWVLGWPWQPGSRFSASALRHRKWEKNESVRFRRLKLLWQQVRTACAVFLLLEFPCVPQERQAKQIQIGHISMLKWQVFKVDNKWFCFNSPFFLKDSFVFSHALHLYLCIWQTLSSKVT